METPKRLRVAVIGLGPIGNRHADIYKTDALAELVGEGLDGVEAAGGQLAGDHGADILRHWLNHLVFGFAVGAVGIWGVRS